VKSKPTFWEISNAVERPSAHHEPGPLPPCVSDRALRQLGIHGPERSLGAFVRGLHDSSLRLIFEVGVRDLATASSRRLQRLNYTDLCVFGEELQRRHLPIEDSPPLPNTRTDAPQVTALPAQSATPEQVKSPAKLKARTRQRIVVDALPPPEKEVPAPSMERRIAAFRPGAEIAAKAAEGFIWAQVATPENLARILPHEARIFIERYADGLTTREIAAPREITVTAVHKLLAKSRRSLALVGAPHDW
jgi:hypothetical protein